MRPLNPIKWPITSQIKLARRLQNVATGLYAASILTVVPTVSAGLRGQTFANCLNSAGIRPPLEHSLSDPEFQKCWNNRGSRTVDWITPTERYFTHFNPQTKYWELNTDLLNYFLDFGKYCLPLSLVLGISSDIAGNKLNSRLNKLFVSLLYDTEPQFNHNFSITDFENYIRNELNNKDECKRRELTGRLLQLIKSFKETNQIIRGTKSWLVY